MHLSVCTGFLQWQWNCRISELERILDVAYSNPIKGFNIHRESDLLNVTYFVDDRAEARIQGFCSIAFLTA